MTAVVLELHKKPEVSFSFALLPSILFPSQLQTLRSREIPLQSTVRARHGDGQRDPQNTPTESEERLSHVRLDRAAISGANNICGFINLCDSGSGLNVSTLKTLK